MRKGGHGGSDVGCELTGCNHTIAIQIGTAVQSLKQRPGEDGVSVGAVVGYLLVGSASGKHLAGFAAGYLG